MITFPSIRQAQAVSGRSVNLYFVCILIITLTQIVMISFSFFNMSCFVVLLFYCLVVKLYVVLFRVLRGQSLILYGLIVIILS